MARGKLRIYLGAAPGVGKTYAMLSEGWRRSERGHDVVIGYVETHGRVNTEEQIRDLEIIPRRIIKYRDIAHEEMDIDAILERHPETVLIDEMAHTNIPGSRNTKRWEDIFECIDAGINVVATLNIQHLESLNDVVSHITGVTQRETVPDLIVRSADQIELVDMSPQALRRRMAHGNIYKAEKIDAALGNFFREHNLGSLRELALLWVADRVDDALKDYRKKYDIKDRWETRERVLVALKGREGEETLIRRAARMAERSRGELIAIHISRNDGVLSSDAAIKERHRALLKELGGRYEELASDNLTEALITFANSVNATQLVLGASQRSRLTNLIAPSIISDVVNSSGHIDVHVVSHDEQKNQRSSIARFWTTVTSFNKFRFVSSLVLTAVLLSLITPIMAAHRDSLDYSSCVLIYLLVTIIVSITGGLLAAAICAVTSSLLLNYYFSPPLHEWTIDQGQHIFALLVFLVVGAVVSTLVDTAYHQRKQARRSRAEAESLARFAAVMVGNDPLSDLLEIVCSTFSVDSAALLNRSGQNFTIEAHAGNETISFINEGDIVETINDSMLLVLRGETLSAEDRTVLHAFASQLQLTINARQEAKNAQQLSQANDLRVAILQAVSHDLRTPLASIKASVSSLRQPDVEFSEDDEAIFLSTIEEETDRLNTLVGNLLDMSRVQARSVAVNIRPLSVDEVIAAALTSLGPRARDITVNIPDDIPLALIDSALLERALANIVDNALKWSPPEHSPYINVGVVGTSIDIYVVDRGPGIPVSEREHVFEPFQRVTDRSNDTGVGLGLAVAKGFVEAMNGELTIDDTPEGGATFVIRVPQS